MEIGLIAPPWLPVPPPAYGGTESVIDRLARGLQDAGHGVVLFTTGDSRCAVPMKWVYREATQDILGQGHVELRHLMHAYEELAVCDVIHDHTLVGPAYGALHRDLNVVTTNHGPFDTELLDIYRAIDDQVAVVAISHHQASTAVGVDIAAVIHHGVDTDEFPVGTGGGGYFAYVGRMTPGKGVREACLAAQHAQAPLRIAAKMREPLEREYFEYEVRPLLSNDIEYVGELTREETTALMGEAIALVNPISWPEPFGLVMVESLACGTPVIAFPAGAAPEIVDEGVTGFLPGSVAEMCARMREVESIDRAACRAVTEDRFSTRRVVAEHVALYERVLSLSLV